MIDDDDDRNEVADDDYIPPPPPDDEDLEREDPNPRAMAPQPTLALVPALPPPVIPITTLVTTECSKCKHVVKPYYTECLKCQGDRNRDRVDAMARAIRELKELSLRGDSDSERERQLTKEIRGHDHPDIEGLLRWCQSAREKAASGGKSPRKKQW